MKISELIEKCKSILEEAGDVDVLVVADRDIEPAHDFVIEVDEADTNKVTGALLLDEKTYLENIERLDGKN